MIKKYVILLAYLLNIFTTVDAHIIIVYGTSCAGKSTLSFQMKKDLPGDYQIMKKSVLAERKKSDYIEKISGVRPQNEEEIRNAIESLPEEQKKIIREIYSEAIRETIEQIKVLSDQGKNIIFDVCLCSLRPFDAFKGYPVLTVLVYAPPKTLLKRAHDRVDKIDQNNRVRISSRQLLVKGLKAFYQPISDDATDSIDTISREDIVKYIPETNTSKSSIELAEKIKKILRYFHLDRKETVKIKPVVNPDILILSEKETVKESSQRIVEYLKSSSSFKSSLQKDAAFSL